jgi:hypothetical protein
VQGEGKEEEREGGFYELSFTRYNPASQVDLCISSMILFADILKKNYEILAIIIFG